MPENSSKLCLQLHILVKYIHIDKNIAVAIYNEPLLRPHFGLVCMYLCVQNSRKCWCEASFFLAFYVKEYRAIKSFVRLSNKVSHCFIRNDNS